MATPILRPPYGVSSPYTVDDPGVLKNPFGLGAGSSGGGAGPSGHGSTTTTAAPTASGGNWVFTVADTTAFNAAGLSIYCSDGTNSIRGHVVSVASSTQLTVAPDSTSGTVTSIANGSTFTFSGVAGPAGANASVYVGVTTNSGNTYTATPSPAITSYVAGTLYTAQFNAANTGATTLNISGLGALNVYKNGAALAGGEIVANASIALTYDGTQLNMTGDGGGGGGLSDWAEATFTASPNNTVGASSLTPISTLTNADAVIGPKGTGALQAQVADGTTAGGNKRGVNAVDFQMVRSVVTQVASGANSFIGGGKANSAVGYLSVIVGGTSNTVGSNRSAILGGNGNSIDAPNSANFDCVLVGGFRNGIKTGCDRSVIVGGSRNYVRTGTYASILGGIYNNIKGEKAVICGGSNNHAYNSYATICGGHKNVASGALSTVAGGQGNTASGNRATISGGFYNYATGGFSGVISGKFNYATNTYSVAAGYKNNATGASSVTICGNFNLANGAISEAAGEQATTRGRRGSHSRSSGKISVQGDSQHCQFSLSAVTTSATAVQMSALPGGSALAANQLALPTGGCATFTGLIVAKDMAAGGTDCSHWSFAGGINNLNGTTALTGAVTPTLIAQTAGASAWAVTITADNTNKTLKVSVSGDAGKTLHWSCFIRDVEVA